MCCAAPVAGNRNPFKTSMYHCWWTKSDKLINQLGRFQQHTTICPGAIFVHHQYRQWFGAQEKHRVFNLLQDGTFKHVFLLLPPLGRRHTEPLTETCLWTTYFNTDDQVNMISDIYADTGQTGAETKCILVSNMATIVYRLSQKKDEWCVHYRQMTLLQYQWWTKFRLP